MRTILGAKSEDMELCARSLSPESACAAVSSVPPIDVAMLAILEPEPRRVLRREASYCGKGNWLRVDGENGTGEFRGDSWL